MDGMIPEGLLSPQQMEQLQQQRTSDFLLALGAGLAQTSQGMGRKPSTLAGITAALPGAVQAQRASFDQTLQQMLRAQQIQDLQIRRQQEDTARQRQTQIQQAMQLPDMNARIDALRNLGAFPELQAMGAAEKAIRPFTRAAGEVSMENPFMVYEQAQSPEVRKLAGQFSKGFESGAIDEEKAYARIADLAKMEDRYISTRESRDIASAIRAEAKTKAEKPTGEQMKAATLAGRLKKSLKDLEEVEKDNPDALTPEVIPSLLESGIISWIPGSDMIAGKIASEDRLRAEAAQLDALDAALTLGTGAAYTREQLRGYAKSYFPQVGDTPKVVQEKVSRFKNLVELAKKQAGPAYYEPKISSPTIDSVKSTYGLE